MEIFNNVLIWILGAVGGITVGGIVAAIIIGCIKGAFNRAIQKMNVEKVAESVVDKQMDRIKAVSFTQNIQPIAVSELKKVTETANAYLKEQLEATQKQYNQIINVLEKFYAYFDDSLVSDKKKQELKLAIEDAKGTMPNSEIAVKEIVIEEPKKKKDNAVVSILPDGSIETPSNGKVHEASKRSNIER